MKGADKGIIMGLAVFGVLIAFYVMVLGPKRSKSTELSDEVATLQAQVDEAEATVAAAEQARKDFPKYYGRLVVLGKAVPEQGDQASMLVQLSAISNRTDLDLRGLTLAQSAGGDSGAAAAAPPPTTTAPASPESTPPPAEGTAPPAEGTTPAPTTDAGTATPAASTTPAPATETAAATLPIGATVGPAGLPTLPYDFTFIGSYFDVANFLASVDSLVTIREGSGQVVSNGRLLTVDGFAMSAPRMGPGGPVLNVNFATTTYVVPSEEGLTVGATPGGPAAPAPAAAAATPASAPVTP